MEFVPWRYVADWRCVMCGDCCRLYSVVISFYEWLGIVRSFGVEYTSSGLDKLFIRRRSDGSCSFLNCGAGVSSCSLQGVKPRACQLWPFKVLMRPEWGFADEAVFSYGDSRVFVYADPMCHGLRFGVPSLDFASFTVKEFVEIALGVRGRQLKTTSSVGLGGSGSGFFGRRVI